MPDQLSAVSRATGRRSYIDHVDPRLRIVVAVVFSITVAVAGRLEVLGLALMMAGLAYGLSGLSLREAVRRLLPLNVLLLGLVVLLPLTTEGTSLASYGSLRFSREGLLLGLTIALKGNAIVLTLLALLGSLDINTLGHALSHLGVSHKLSHLLLFTVRYLDVLKHEYGRMRSAMKVRGFRPRFSRHTYRSYGYLVGMLLVRSFDRSERIAAAMKCRGFHGRFYLLDHFAFSRHDVPFAVASLVLLLVLVLLQWI
jgi:cobalt/nickel transport system permease protein